MNWERQSLKPKPNYLSHSQVKRLCSAYTYSCPRSWGFSYLAGLPFLTSPAIEMGRAFDEAANQFFLLRMATESFGESFNQSVVTATKELRIGFERARNEGNKNFDGFDVEQYVATLEAAFLAFCEEHRDTIPAEVQTRHEFKFKTLDGGVFEHMGYSDRIDQDGRIVDHKFTSSAKWDKNGVWKDQWVNETKDQIVVYWLSRISAARIKKEPEPPGLGRLTVIYANARLVKPQVRSIDFDLTEYDRERVLGNIRSAKAIIDSGRLPARPGDHCARCSYLLECRQCEIDNGQRFSDLTGLPMAS